MLNCEEAYRYVKAKRATISPNFNFLGQLLEYEKQLTAEGILDKKPAPTFSSSFSQASEIVHGPELPILSTPPSSTRTTKRFNLSLRLSPLSSTSSLSSPKDASPTTAMARLQFDKPQGKENRTGNGSQPSTSSGALGMPSCLNFGFNLSRPNRLVKEQNMSSIKDKESAAWNSMTKSVTKQSLSLSFSKEFRSRKCAEQYQRSEATCSPSKEEQLGVEKDADCTLSSKKCRIHKIILDKTQETDKTFSPNPTVFRQQSSASSSSVSDSIHSDIVPSPLGGKRDYHRSDSVSTSGLGSGKKL